MAWYEWLIIAVIAAALLGILAFRLIRASIRGRRFLGLSVRGKVTFGRTLLLDRETPILARVTLIVLVGYLALPFDLIPDFIPVVGQLDDLLIVTAAIALLLAIVPRERFEAALEAAESSDAARARPAPPPRASSTRSRLHR